MLPAVTCVLLAQLAAAAVPAPLPWPPGWDTGLPVKIVHLDPAQASAVRLYAAQARPARDAQPVCPFRMRVADPSLDPGMVSPWGGENLDPGIAGTIRCRPLNVATERR